MYATDFLRSCAGRLAIPGHRLAQSGMVGSIVMFLLLPTAIGGEGGSAALGGTVRPADCRDSIRVGYPNSNVDFTCDGVTSGFAMVLDSVCPNGSCEDGEDSCNCPQDCGDPPSNEVPGVTCNNDADDDCDGNIDCEDPDCPVSMDDIIDVSPPHRAIDARQPHDPANTFPYGWSQLVLTFDCDPTPLGLLPWDFGVLIEPPPIPPPPPPPQIVSIAYGIENTVTLILDGPIRPGLSMPWIRFFLMILITRKRVITDQKRKSNLRIPPPQPLRLPR